MFVRIYVLKQYTLFLGQFSKILEDWRMWSLKRERVFSPFQPPNINFTSKVWLYNLKSWCNCRLYFKIHVLQWDLIVCSNYRHHSRISCWQIWRINTKRKNVFPSHRHHTNFSSQVWFWNLKSQSIDSWLLRKQDKSRSNPTAIASAHNAATMPIVPTCVIIMRFDYMLKL